MLVPHIKLSKNKFDITKECSPLPLDIFERLYNTGLRCPMPHVRAEPVVINFTQSDKKTRNNFSLTSYVLLTFFLITNSSNELPFPELIMRSFSRILSGSLNYIMRCFGHVNFTLAVTPKLPVGHSLDYHLINIFFIIFFISFMIFKNEGIAKGNVEWCDGLGPSSSWGEIIFGSLSENSFLPSSDHMWTSHARKIKCIKIEPRLSCTMMR